MTTLLPPERECFPNRRRWSVDECNQMSALGILTEKYELIDGEVIIRMGQKPAHRISVVLVVEWLMSLFGARHVQSEDPIALQVPDGLYNEPEPDVAVTREPTTAYKDRHPGPADLLLVLEVSDSSISADLLVKSKLYARAGIPEFWTLDLTTRRLLVHRQPLNGEYSLVTTHSESEDVATIARPDAHVRVGNLLPQE